VPFLAGEAVKVRFGKRTGHAQDVAVGIVMVPGNNNSVGRNQSGDIPISICMIAGMRGLEIGDFRSGQKTADAASALERSAQVVAASVGDEMRVESWELVRFVKLCASGGESPPSPVAKAAGVLSEMKNGKV
jgi:hypothetical protein